MISSTKFKQLSAAGYTHIPLIRSIPLPLGITPVNAYLRLADSAYSYLLESAGGGMRWGRYSMIGLNCTQRIEIRDLQIRLFMDSVCVEEFEHDDPLAWIKDFTQQFCLPQLAKAPAFTGGLVGYFGYESARYIEPVLARCTADTKTDPLNCPDILLLVSQEILVFDNLENQLHFIIHADVHAHDAYSCAIQRIKELNRRLITYEEKPLRQPSAEVDETYFVSEFGAEHFQSAVKKTLHHIIDGDVMQLVLSQRLSVPFDGHPFACYCQLRKINPSPYMYYFNLGDFYIAGASPEILVRVEGDEVTVRPIAGTRPRQEDAAADLRTEKELLADEKELAEHLMLIDLGRNDIGRVCTTGSVQVTELMVIERYSHVMHIVSHVVGKRHQDASLIDILRATFPAGTVSGAPKIKAMELIDNLETTKRGIYSGAVGYLSWNDTMDLAIAIRTLIVKDDRLYAQAGAGLVYDSEPFQEWQETMSKARVMMQAAELASRR